MSINTKIEIVHNLAEDVWRNFVDQHPLGNIFHTPEMFQVFSGAFGHQPMIWAVVQDGLPITLLSVVRVSLMVREPFRLFTTRAVVYGGVLCLPGQGSVCELEKLLLNYLHQTGRQVLFTEFRNLYDGAEFQPAFQKIGFKFEDHNDYIVDLRFPIEQIWRNIHKSARKDIRRAEKMDSLSVLEITDKKMLPQWYEVLKKSFSWNQAYLADLSLFESAFEVLYPKRMIQFLVCKLGDQIIAASAALLYKDTIYGWYRGFDRNYSNCFPNELMVWHVFKWGVENGFKFFDFGGAGRPNEEYGPRNFKAKFGGVLVNFGRNIFVHAPFRLHLSSLGYEMFRKLPRG